MITELGIKRIGGSLAIIIPPMIAKWLGIKEGDVVNMQDEEGKKGRYVTVWKDE